MSSPPARATPASENAASAAPFDSSEEFCRLASAWAAHLAKREILRSVALGFRPEGDGSNLLDRAVDSLDAEAAGAPPAPDERLAAAGAEAVRAARTLQARLAATRIARPDAPLPFIRMCGEFELDSTESSLLLLVITVATEPRVARLVEALHGVASHGRCNAGVALRLLTPAAQSGNLPWHLLAPDGRLRAHGLVTVEEGAAAPPLPARDLAVPDSVAAYATRGQAWLDDAIAPFSRLVTPERGWDELRFPAEPKRLLRRRLALATGRGNAPVQLLLRGSVGSGRKAATLAICRELGRRLLVLDVERLPASEEGTVLALRAAIRDARLAGAQLYLENAEALRRDPGVPVARLRATAALLQHAGGLVFLATERADRIDVEDALAPTSVEVPELTGAERRLLWRAALPRAIDPDGKLADRLVASFPVNPGDIARAQPDIHALAAASAGVVDGHEVVRLVLERSRHNLRAVAAPVPTPYDLDDIVLPDDVRAQCLQLLALVDRFSILHDDWGLGRRVLTHRGVSALFAGPPGTGKTMMAGILGRRLGLDVFRIDVSQVISRWVGETEKNLARLFAEAARTRAVLVFDEADALFSRRTDVKQAVDRYANVQVNYLLQKMESFEGIMVLTTNLEKQLDEAFRRRIQFRVVFPEPGPRERERIWRLTLPPEVELDGVDLPALAERYALSGGAIRNAAVRACLFALERQGGRRVVTTADLTQAILDEVGRDLRRSHGRGGSGTSGLY
jgi:hypothetical protein